MNKPSLRRPVPGLLLAALGVGLIVPSGALGQQPVPPAEAQAPTADPKVIWPAGLDRLAGRFVFVQVGSPGGLWRKEGLKSRQIAIDDLPTAMQTKLRAAEIVISDIKLPTQVEASESLSPSKRGMIRHFSESALGRLVIKNLPGAAASDAVGDYSGPALFHLEHSLHSNPSLTGVLEQRLNQEGTWGAATLDYADLGAEVYVPEPAAPPKNGQKRAEKEQPDAETAAPISNARVMRNGQEIFVFVSWIEKVGKVEREYLGTVRMVKESSKMAPRPAPTGDRGAAPKPLIKQLPAMPTAIPDR